MSALRAGTRLGSGERERSEASALLVDIGNTRVKWAIWREGRLGRMHAAAHGGWTERDYEQQLLAASGAGHLARIIVASVAGPRVNQQLAAAARKARGLRAEWISTSRRAAGVSTRYAETWRLGVDRFLGVIGARSLAGARAVCVVNAGTAVTIDLIDARGVHRGGAILPGTRLMVSSLLRETAGIERRAREKAASRHGRARERGNTALFARSTRAAIEHGAVYALAAVVDRAVLEAHRILGTAPVAILTGGAADELHPLIRARHRRVADLVLRGIAAHEGLAVRSSRRGRAARHSSAAKISRDAAAH